MILAAIREKNQNNSHLEEMNQSEFESTGLGCIFNKSDKNQFYEVSAQVSNMTLLPPYEDCECYDLVVPAGGAAICLAMKTIDWYNFEFKCNSSHSGEAPHDSVPPTFVMGAFVSTKVAQDDNEDEDNYYDYYSASLKKAKEEEDA